MEIHSPFARPPAANRLSVEAWGPEVWWLAYLAMGLLTGFLAGMLGIGGGVVIVPLLVFLFNAQHLPSERVLHLALGTSLASIAFTNLSSVRAHHAHHAVRWEIVRVTTPGIIIGTLLGTVLAEHLSSRYLAIVFTLFVLFSSVQMLLDRKPKPTRQLPGAVGMWIAALSVGLLCSLVGVAGGILIVPLLAMCNVPMRNCIGTSAAVGLPISLAGAAGYVVAGLAKAHLPSYSIGYVYIPALSGLVLGTFVTVPFGARVAHTIPVTRLKKIFAIVLSVLAVKMVIALF
jgi:uncharacterized protein